MERSAGGHDSQLLLFGLARAAAAPGLPGLRQPGPGADRDVAGCSGVNILDARVPRPGAALRAAIPRTIVSPAVAYRAVDGGAPELEAAPVFIDCVLEQAHRRRRPQDRRRPRDRISHNSPAPPLLYRQGRLPQGDVLTTGDLTSAGSGRRRSRGPGGRREPPRRCGEEVVARSPRPWIPPPMKRLSRPSLTAPRMSVVGPSPITRIRAGARRRPRRLQDECAPGA